MSKHTWFNNGDTPAPWVVDDDEVRVAVHDANGGVVCDCTDGFHGTDGEWRMAQKSYDVARLIAAAPDLLDALRKLELMANTVDACYTRNPGNFAVALRALRENAEAARAAIQRATGQS